MTKQYTHPTDEELLSFVDGELSSGNSLNVARHLAACWECRTRRKTLEETIAELVEAHHQALDPKVPPAAGPRALLAAHMAELVKTRRTGFRLSTLLQPFGSMQRHHALIAAAVLILVIGIGYRFASSRALAGPFTSSQVQVVPDTRLTPGSVRPISVSEICSLSFSDDAEQVPASIKEQVFQEYKVSRGQAGNYELDYLVSPQLGGTADIRNLWPEPKSSATWNMRAKDVLEDHLYELVCQGKLDLATAQRDLAMDWISAYEKYFHTRAPLTPS